MTAAGRHRRLFGYSARRYDADPVRRPYNGRHRRTL
jgi:hypothetical protein